jgi:hypothetical protein
LRPTGWSGTVAAEDCLAITIGAERRRRSIVRGCRPP